MASKVKAASPDVSSIQFLLERWDVIKSDLMMTFYEFFERGGPGSGKSTQCANVVKHFGFTLLSTSDLLRAEIQSGSKTGTMIEKMMKEGKIIPSEVTIKLLQRAMLENDNDKFLIDGFPRNEENRTAFENMKIEPEFVLFLYCSEGEMEKRILGRNQGRVDDNIDTMRRRFKVFQESTLPVIEYYSAKGKLRKINAGKSVEEVFEAVKNIFLPGVINIENGFEGHIKGVKHIHVD